MSDVIVSNKSKKLLKGTGQKLYLSTNLILTFMNLRRAIKGKSIFISHATKDKIIIDAFVDKILHGALSVPIDEIFCVSTDGTKITSGDNWRESIRHNIVNAKIIFLIITPNYKESEICLNEMGAAWVTEAVVLPVIVEPINYKSVGAIQEPSQIEKLLDEKSLDRIKDIVQEELKIPSEKIKSDRWTSKKNEFLIKSQKYLAENKFQIPLDRIKFEEILESNIGLKKTIESLIEDKDKLERLIEKLKAAKDKEDVKKIIAETSSFTDVENFKDLIESVKAILDKNHGIINGVIFKTYTRKSITIKWDNYKEVIDEAIANDFIDDELDANWSSTKEMMELEKALDNLRTFIGSDLTEDFIGYYEENYNAPFDIGNKKFWEEVLDVDVYFS